MKPTYAVYLTYDEINLIIDMLVAAAEDSYINDCYDIINKLHAAHLGKTK